MSTSATNAERPLIIVADDEAMLRIMISQYLEDSGFAVVEAADGLEAFHETKTHPDCCLLISDVKMPNMDGYSLAKSVLELMPYLPVLLMTGYADPIPEALRTRVTLLKKPFPIEDLCERAKMICGASQVTCH